jgi:hypothetical protein
MLFSHAALATELASKAEAEFGASVVPTQGAISVKSLWTAVLRKAQEVSMPANLTLKSTAGRDSTFARMLMKNVGTVTFEPSEWKKITNDGHDDKSYCCVPVQCSKPPEEIKLRFNHFVKTNCGYFKPAENEQLSKNDCIKAANGRYDDIISWDSAVSWLATLPNPRSDVQVSPYLPHTPQMCTCGAYTHTHTHTT